MDSDLRYRNRYRFFCLFDPDSDTDTDTDWVRLLSGLQPLLQQLMNVLAMAGVIRLRIDPERATSL